MGTWSENLGSCEASSAEYFLTSLKASEKCYEDQYQGKDKSVPVRLHHAPYIPLGYFLPSILEVVSSTYAYTCICSELLFNEVFHEFKPNGAPQES